MIASAPPRAGLLSRRGPALWALPLGGALVALAFAEFGFGPRGWISAYVVAVLCLLSAIDLERRILPNSIVLPSAAIVLAAQIAFFPERAPEWALASVGAAALLALPLLVHPAGMGLGDVKLGLLLGAALGKSVVAGLLIGFLAAWPVALYILVRGGFGARKRTFAFGPLLAFGAVVALFLAASG